MSPAGMKMMCLILVAIALAIGLTNGDKIGPLVYRTCKHEQDCKFPGGTCNSTIRQCVCLKNFVPSSNKQSCVSKADSIEASCTDENQCLAFSANTTCENGKCVCISGHHYIDNACWKTVAIDEECANNYECYQAEDYENDPPIKSVICDSNRCTCADNFVLSENKCVTMKSDVSAGSSFALALSLIVPVIALTFLS